MARWIPLPSAEPKEATIDRLTKILRHQHGFITSAQARSAGLSHRQIQHRVDSGRWVRRRNGVYLLATTPITWEVRVRAATFGRVCVVSHRSASVLWGLELFAEPKPEITVPSGAHPDPAVTIHKSTQWDLVDAVRRRSMPCTGIERTIVDCASVCDLDTLERLAESAIRQELTTWKQLAACAELHAGRGRRGPANAARLIRRRADALQVARSDFSLRVKHLLVEAGLPEPALEFPVRTPAGKHVLYLDLAWPDLLKAWELDGRKWHSGMQHYERDRVKRNAVKSYGWAIQEITVKMLDEPTALVELARRFLGA